MNTINKKAGTIKTESFYKNINFEVSLTTLFFSEKK